MLDSCDQEGIGRSSSVAYLGIDLDKKHKEIRQ